MLNKKIKDILDKNGVLIRDDSGCIECEKYTPLGEDWNFQITGYNSQDFITNLERYYNDFDVDDEASFWIEHKGENGTPDSVEDLLEDATWKKYFLDLLVKELKGDKEKNQDLYFICKDELYQDFKLIYLNELTREQLFILALEKARGNNDLKYPLTCKNKDKIKQILISQIESFTK